MPDDLNQKGELCYGGTCPPLGFQTIMAISSDINFMSSEMLSWEKIERETLIYNIWRHLHVQC